MQTKYKTSCLQHFTITVKIVIQVCQNCCLMCNFIILTSNAPEMVSGCLDQLAVLQSSDSKLALSVWEMVKKGVSAQQSEEREREWVRGFSLLARLKSGVRAKSVVHCRPQLTIAVMKLYIIMTVFMLFQRYTLFHVMYDVNQCR